MNRFVDADVARFVHRLIVIDDDTRPVAAAALADAERLKTTLAARNEAEVKPRQELLF